MLWNMKHRSGFSGLTFPAKGTELKIQDEGLTVETNCNTLNFIGADVQALSAGTGIVSIYIPPIIYASHYDTTDGSTTGTVSESITRTTAMIGTPTSEGNPFSTNGWAGTNQAASTATSVVLTPGGECTGFGGDASMTVTVYDANGTSVLETRTTAAITGNGAYGAGNIAIAITGYAADSLRFKATPTVTVAIGTILTDAGREGGRYHVVSAMTTSTATDTGATYTYTQTAVFLDSNPNTPSLSTVSIAETGGSVLTKHLSGVEYYILNSAFTAAIGDIDNLNRNTARTTANVQITFTNYGTTTLSQSPLSGGAGNADFTGWTSAYDNVNTSYSNNAVTITSASFRYRGTGALISARARDTWANNSYVNSASASILIDTVTTSSTDLVEDFDDEARRQDSGFNSGGTGGNWNSATTLVGGEAQVMGGELIVPSQGTLTTGGANADWSTYSPTAGGANPNYSGIGVAVNYYRTIVDSSGSSRAGFTMSFSGTFVANATTDLANSHLQIFVSRIGTTSGGQTGPTNPFFLKMHGALYNFATFNDTTDVQIREGSSSGNTVNCTFGGYDCTGGLYMRILLNNTAIKIDRLAVSFS